MASFDKRANGKWRVQVRRQGLGSVSRSFLRKSDAEKWARETEAEIERGEYQDKAQKFTHAFTRTIPHIQVRQSLKK
jgi:hypothetical protein